MNIPLVELVGRLGRRLEPVIFGLLLLWQWDLDLPPGLIGPLKAASYGILAIFIIPQWKRFIYFSLSDIPLLILLGVAVVSFFWSAAPDYTSNEIKALVRSTMFGIYMGMRYSPKEQMRLLAWIVGITALFSVVVFKAMPDYAIVFINNQYCWKGILTHKQYLGRMMTIGSMILLLTAISSKKYRLFALSTFSVMVTIILLSRSRTSLVILLIGFFTLPLYKIVKQHFHLRVFLLFTAFMLSVIIAILVAINLEFIVVDTLGKNLEFNGRIPIWTLIIDKALERPWLGYGYAGFWTSPEAFYVLNNSWAGGVASASNRFHAHNGFIDLFIQLGVIGLLLFIVHFVILFVRVWNLFYLNKNLEYFWMVQFLISILLFNLTEAITILTNNTLWIIYVSVATFTAIQEARSRKNKQLKVKLDQSYEDSLSNNSYP